MTDTPALVTRLRDFADELSKYQDTYSHEEACLREAADALSLGVARLDWEHAESSRVDAVWIEVLEAIGHAWETPQSYGESPIELITRLIDERDDAEHDRDVWKALAEGSHEAHQQTKQVAEQALLLDALDQLVAANRYLTFSVEGVAFLLQRGIQRGAGSDEKLDETHEGIPAQRAKARAEAAEQALAQLRPALLAQRNI